MAGEDEILKLEGGLTTRRTIEDNLHSYTNDASVVAVGDVVYQVSGVDDKVDLADADNASARPPIGVVTQVTDTTNCIVCHSGGIATGLSGLTRGSDYWLTTTGTTGNTLTASKPSSDAYLVGVALSATSMLVSTVPADLAGSGIGGSTGSTDEAILRADGTGGSTLQASGITIDDSDNINNAVSLGMLEQTSAPSASAGSGYFWAFQHNTSSGGNLPVFTDDTGDDYSLQRSVILNRTLSATDSDYVELGSIASTNRPINFSITVTNGLSAAQSIVSYYRVFATNNLTSGNYQRLRPQFSRETGGVVGDNYTVVIEIAVSSTEATMRARQVGGFAATACVFRITLDGHDHDQFTPDASTGSEAPITTEYTFNVAEFASRMSSSVTNAGFVSYVPAYFLERASAGGDVSDYGQLWVRDDAPNNPMFTNDSGTDFQIGMTSETPAASEVARWNGTAGQLRGSNVIINNSGDLYPETDGAGTLGDATHRWEDVFLATDAVITWESGATDVTLTHSASALAFAGATSGYSFDDDLILGNGDSLQFGNSNTQITGDGTVATGDLSLYAEDRIELFSGSDTSNPQLFLNSEGVLEFKETTGISNPTTSYVGLYANEDAFAAGHLVWRNSNHSPENSREYNVLSTVRNPILHSNQFETGTSRIKQATTFWATLVAAFDTANPDTFTISDGSTTETFTAVVTESSSFEFAVGANAIASLTNLAQAINDDSTLWDAQYMSSSEVQLGNKQGGATNGMIVIYRTTQFGASANDRIYGDFSNQNRVFHIDYSGHPDYRAIGENSNYTGLSSTDPAARTFGYGSTTTILQGDIVASILDYKLYQTDVFSTEWMLIAEEGSVSGTGTTNKLAYWDSSTSVADVSSMTVSGNDLQITSGHIRLDSGERYEWGTGSAYIEGDSTASTGDITLRAPDDFLFQAAGTSTNDFILSADGTVGVREIAGPPTNVSDYGQFWVKSVAPNVPAFTDDVSSDFLLVGFNDASTTADNAIARYDGATGSYIQDTDVTINDDGDILPDVTSTQDLGSSSLRWQNLYLGAADIDFTSTLEIRTGGTALWEMTTAGILRSTISTAEIGLGSAGNVKFQTPDGSAMVLNPVTDVVIQEATTEWVRFDASSENLIVGSGATGGGSNEMLHLKQSSANDCAIRLVSDSNTSSWIFTDDSATDSLTLQSSSNLVFLSNGLNERGRFNTNGTFLIGGHTSTLASYQGLDIRKLATGSLPIAYIDNSAASGVTIKRILRLAFSGDATISTSEDWIQFTKSSGSEVGRIHSEVVYGTFTGSHVAQVDSALTEGKDGTGYYDVPVATNRYWEPGMIVRSTGVTIGAGDISNQPIEITLADASQQKAAIGVFVNARDPGHTVQYTDTNRYVIDYNAIGEGKVLVTDKGGDVDLGDYITTSTIVGYGKKQSDDIMHTYTVAKCTEQVDWSSVTDTIDEGPSTYKYALVSCIYHCG
jgi:hypothetical protein